MKINYKNKNLLQKKSASFVRSSVVFFGFLVCFLIASHIHASTLRQFLGSASNGTNKPPTLRIFVTSTTYNGNLGGLAGADAKCQARANAASLGGTWKAILSDSTTDASERLDVAGYNIIDMKGRLAVPNGNLWSPNYYDGANNNYLLLSLNLTELKTDATSSPWTSTNYNGGKYASATCLNWSSNSSANTAVYAWMGQINTYWIGYNSDNCSLVHSLYCIEQK